MSELDYMDALAAEYVLGTLDVEERTQARSLLEADEAFAAKVRLWERRFGDLHLMVEPVEPDSAIWARIRAKMLEVRQQIHASQPAIAAFASETTAAESASRAVAEPPSLDAIEAAIAQAATTLSAEASSVAPPPPQSEVPPVGSEVRPAGSEVPPVEADVPPVEAEVPPAGPEVRPAEAEVAPAASEVRPAEATVSAAGPEVPRAEAEVTPSAPEVPPAGSEVTPTSVSEATPAPASEPTSALVSDAPPAPPEATRTSAAEAALTSPVAAVAAAAEAPSDTRAQAAERAVLDVHRQLRRWRAFAIVMTLVVVAVAALLAAWSFVPDRVPSMLQPLELMRQIGVTLPAAPAPRRPAPPESQFDE